MYNCKSDNLSPCGADDIVMSTTCFTEKRITFSVIYGCTENVMRNVLSFLGRMKGKGNSSAFHPLMMPMIYVELERKRLVNMLERKTSDLQGRIDKMETTLKEESEMENRTLSERDCETTKLWLSISSLRNGLESLKAQLLSMSEHCRMTWKENSPSNDRGAARELGERITTRLRVITDEFDTKIRDCDRLLGGTSLAARMVSIPFPSLTS